MELTKIDYSLVKYYKVKYGQTLNRLCDFLCFPQKLLIDENNLESELYEGQVIIFPSVNGYSYKARVVDTTDSICEKFELDKETFLKRNNIDYVFAGLWVLI